MTYAAFRDTIANQLRRTPAGLTWTQLRQRLALPYDRPCPTWTKQLEHDIASTRVKGQGRALVWKVGRRAKSSPVA